MDTLALHSAHASLGATFGDWNGRELVLHYGDARGEYTAGRQASVLVDLSARQVLRITGEDRITFLHGMVTNDVSGLAEGQVTYAAMVTAKGAMVADARIWRRAGDLLLDVEPGLGPKVKEFLERYLISEDAELSDVSSEWALFGLWGPDAAEVLRAAGLPQPTAGAIAGGSLEGIDVQAVASSVFAPGVELLVPASGARAVFEALRARARPAGMEAVEVLRVEAGVPRYGLDMDDRTIPLEANLTRAIHYNKGCYIGQEVIARATFRGHMNRHLLGLLCGDRALSPKTELRSGDKKAGWVTSCVFSPELKQFVALGYVHRDFEAPGTVLDAVGTEARVTVHALPLRPA